MEVSIMPENSEFLTKQDVSTPLVDQPNEPDSGSVILSQAYRSAGPNRHNRLCVVISDIHLTDGSVGIQNLGKKAWDDFFSAIEDTCQNKQIQEVHLIFDGDFIDIIRSGEWAERNFYPWQRKDDNELFNDIVNRITQKILELHEYFFSQLKTFDSRMKDTCESVESTKTIIVLGNHDKEILLVNDALANFYEHALGRTAESFTDSERRYIGRMYGDENMFLTDKSRFPYFPFYHADKDFRFFTTHGQWRDSENSVAIEAEGDDPGWCADDGWQPQIWSQLNYRPFIEACFGDTVAAGVLSTFIFKTKRELASKNIVINRLNRILDELDLYRPSYLAVQRIIEESKAMRKAKRDIEAVEIIEKNLTLCVTSWLSWDFTHQSASKKLRFPLKFARFTLKALKIFGKKIELSAILWGMKGFARLSHQRRSGVNLKKMRTFPGFQPPFSNNGFQIHGEGHTHNPLEEEANLNRQLSDATRVKFNTNFTYVNFGTWRDQILARKDKGYRRRGVLRTFNILDLKASDDASDQLGRQFFYYTQDVAIWRDSLDRINEKETQEESVQLGA